MTGNNWEAPPQESSHLGEGLLILLAVLPCVISCPSE